MSLIIALDLYVHLVIYEIIIKIGEQNMAIIIMIMKVEYEPRALTQQNNGMAFKLNKAINRVFFVIDHTR